MVAELPAVQCGEKPFHSLLNLLNKVYPTTNGGMQNESSVGICTCCIHAFALLGTDLYAQSVLINKIYASELSQKFVKSALLIG